MEINWYDFFRETTRPQTLADYANDTAAAAGGVPLYGLYRTGSTVKVRTTLPVPPDDLAWGGTIRNVTASGDITAALQAAIDASAADGDVIAISAGTCSMSTVSWSNKNIYIHGAGKASTVITANSGFGQITYTGSNIPAFRLSALTLTSTSSGLIALTVWAMGSQTLRGGFRIDNVNWNYPNNGATIYFFGPQWGLIDHCDFPGGYEAAILFGWFTDVEYNSWHGGSNDMNLLEGSAGLALAFTPGNARALYIENCTFTGTDDGQVFSCIDTNRVGGRCVFRYNTILNAMLYAHWTGGFEVNCMWCEIYNNTFTMTTGLAPYPMRWHGGGTGLIYNNDFDGYLNTYILLGEGRMPVQNQSSTPLLLIDGTHNWDGNAGDTSAPGWPALCQTGRDSGKTMAQIQAGVKQPSFPLYIWGNTGDAFTVAVYDAGETPPTANYFKSAGHTVTGAGYGHGDVDYSITGSQPSGAGTHTLTYTAWTYPYPLNARGLPNPP